jgi:carbonic anhydrase
MPVLNELLEANERFAEGFEKGDLPMPPARQVAVLTCMERKAPP